MNAIKTSSHQPWNKGKLVGQKSALRLKDIWAIRVRLQIAEETRDSRDATGDAGDRRIAAALPRSLHPVPYRWARSPAGCRALRHFQKHRGFPDGQG